MALAAIVSALASGGLAVAISYRLWGARSNDTADRLDALEAKFSGIYTAISETKTLATKTDAEFTDFARRLNATAEASVAKRAKAASFWCYRYERKAGEPEVGFCTRTPEACEQMRSATTKFKPDACAQQDHAVCTNSSEVGGANPYDDCFTTLVGCQFSREEFVKQSTRVFSDCAPVGIDKAKADATSPKWECTALYYNTGHDYTDGVCGASSSECERLRMETLSRGKPSGNCAKQPKVFCYDVEGVPSCRPNPVSCEANRKHDRDVEHLKVGECANR